MKAINIKATAEALTKHLFATGENRLGNEFYVTACALVEEVAAIGGEGVGFTIAKKISNANRQWHANLSPKMAYAIAYAIAECVKNGKIDVENYRCNIICDDDEKPAKKAEKPAKKTTDWKKAKAEKAEAEKKAIAEVVEVCKVGAEVEHVALGHGVVAANDGNAITIEFGAKGLKVLSAMFLAGKIMRA